MSADSEGHDQIKLIWVFAESGNILSWILIWNIFFTIILSLLLIQEGQLSVSGERMCNHLLGGQILSSKSVWLGKLIG